jgi:hypothetical protein
MEQTERFTCHDGALGLPGLFHGFVKGAIDKKH